MLKGTVFIVSMFVYVVFVTLDQTGNRHDSVSLTPSPACKSPVDDAGEAQGTNLELML